MAEAGPIRAFKHGSQSLIWAWLKIEQEGGKPQVLVHVSTYQGKPFWVPNLFLSHKHFGEGKIPSTSREEDAITPSGYEASPEVRTTSSVWVNASQTLTVCE